MRAAFSAGERVFITSGLSVLEARVRGRRYGRYVVVYQSICCEGEGCICVSGSRMYRTQAEAAAVIDKVRAARRAEKPRPRAPIRADEPGDGWAIR